MSEDPEAVVDFLMAPEILRLKLLRTQITELSDPEFSMSMLPLEPSRDLEVFLEALECVLLLNWRGVGFLIVDFESLELEGVLELFGDLERRLIPLQQAGKKESSE